MIADHGEHIEHLILLETFDNFSDTGVVIFMALISSMWFIINKKTVSSRFLRHPVLRA